jgi:pyruvate formate lyase activating enzyme
LTGSPTAPVFDIQRFSIHDGPGIRTLVFFKGCNLHCDWCQNPEAHDAQPIVAFYADRCRGSFSCEEVCAEQAINRSGFRINPDRCTVCGDCVESCAYSALRLIGERLTPEELMDRVLPDKAYFDSGGGVTLSGGEPTLYPKFLDRFVDLCVRSGIHIGIETAGRFSLEKCLPILEKVDLIYFDLKILDPVRHEQAVGKGLETILSNAEYLATNGFPVEFRMPLVPGYTDTEENIDAAIELLKSIGHPRLHLLEYHNMGEVKIDIIQGKQPKLGLNRYSDESLAAIAHRFEKAGIEIANRRSLHTSRAR